jgi:hypothetical protein
VEEWDLEDEWLLDEQDFFEGLRHDMCFELADLVFLSANNHLPEDGDAYNLGYLDGKDWWPLVKQLDGIVDLVPVVRLLTELNEQMSLPGVPTELLEIPVDFLQSVLLNGLPREPSGRRVGSRKLVKIARLIAELLKELPETAQAAVRAWADVYRNLEGYYDAEYYGMDDLGDLLLASDLPPAMTGFSMLIALTLMQWPKRAEGLPLPPGFADPSLYDDVLAEWTSLPDTPSVTEEGTGEAEALFAQGQLAHMLAEMGTVELIFQEDVEEQDAALAYSRLSRAILWVHGQCRHCPKRDGVACQVASSWPERPVPLLDVAGEIANTGRVEGCINM